MQQEEVPANTMKVEGEKKSAKIILDGLTRARDYFQPYQSLCDEIDQVYSDAFDTWSNSLVRDVEYDTFWAYDEVMKPAVYARMPIPVVAPMFNDRRPLYVTTAEMLERAEISAFQRADIDEPMKCTRDDLIMYSRGTQWVVLEDTDDGKKICVDHLDRKDFRHAPARKWSEVPWVARGVWMYEAEFKDRFKDAVWEDLTPAQTTDIEGYTDLHQGQARVWEVWHKGDKKVYWVAEGYPDILEESKPHLDLKGFFPCPRPAYGSCKPGTLMPIPDYTRYVGHFRQINSLTRRIYTLLDRVRMKGLIASGGDLGTAIEALLADDTNASFLIPIDSAAMMNSPGQAVQWLPIKEIAEAIQGLLAARTEIFADFDRLSGISDIMRGETDAQETLGAQRLKSQYGSIRVRGKIDELVRVARDVTQIAAEIMAEEFDSKLLLEMSQMEIPTEAEIKRQMDELESQAEEEMRGLAMQAQQAGQQAEQGPQAAQQAFQQAQQQIIAKYAPQLQRLSQTVPIEAVMKLLKDNKARCFAFEIQTDSTVMTDEAQAKAAANEFYTAFTGGMQGLIGAASMGEEAIRAAAELLKYTLSPYRPPRAVIAAIDDFLDAAPEIAERQAAANAEGGPQEDMAALAEAEMEKARVAGQKVQMDAQKAQMDLQQKQMSMEAEFQEKAVKLQQEQEKIAQKGQELAMKYEELQAKIDNTRADTMKKIADAGVAVDSQALDEFKSLSDIELRKSEIAVNQANRAEDMAVSERDKKVDTTLRVRDSERAAQMGDRQQTLAERQAEQSKGNGK